MEMIESRIMWAHIYDEGNADEIAKLIYSEYIKLFDDLANTMEKLIEK